MRVAGIAKGHDKHEVAHPEWAENPQSAILISSPLLVVTVYPRRTRCNSQISSKQLGNPRISTTDVQCATRSQYQLERLYTAFPPSNVMLKEACKASEMGTIPPYILSGCSCLILVGEKEQLHVYALGPQESHVIIPPASNRSPSDMRIHRAWCYPQSITKLLRALGVKNIEMHQSVMRCRSVHKAQKFLKKEFEPPRRTTSLSTFHPPHEQGQTVQSQLDLCLPGTSCRGRLEAVRRAQLRLVPKGTS